MRDVPGIYPALCVGAELIALAVSGSTSHEHDSNVLITAHVLLAVFLSALAYLMHKKQWKSDFYMPLNIACCLLYGVVIGEHKQAHVAEFLFTLLSLCACLVCFMGVARMLDLENTIASSEDIATDDGNHHLQAQGNLGP